MGTTTNMGFRYPSGTVGVAPDVAGDIHNLASDVDARFGSTSIDRVNGLPYTDDWNAALAPGTYRIAGSATNLNSPIGAGAYGFGTLTVSTSGNSVSQVYVAAVGPTLWFRTKWNTSDWTAWSVALGQYDASITGNGTTAAGFTASRFSVLRYGRVVTVDFSAFRSGGTITGTPSGNIANVVLGNVGNWKPQNMWAPLSAGPGGPSCSFAIERATGNLVLAAMPPSYNLTNGQELTCGGSFITDN